MKYIPAGAAIVSGAADIVSGAADSNEDLTSRTGSAAAQNSRATTASSTVLVPKDTARMTRPAQHGQSEKLTGCSPFSQGGPLPKIIDQDMLLLDWHL